MFQKKLGWFMMLKPENSIQASNYLDTLSKHLCYLDKDTPLDRDGDLLLFAQSFQLYVKGHCLSSYLDDAKAKWQQLKHAEDHLMCASYEGSIESTEQMRDYIMSVLIACLMADSTAETVLNLGLKGGDVKSR